MNVRWASTTLDNLVHTGGMSLRADVFTDSILANMIKHSIGARILCCECTSVDCCSYSTRMKKHICCIVVEFIKGDTRLHCVTLRVVIVQWNVFVSSWSLTRHPKTTETKPSLSVQANQISFPRWPSLPTSQWPWSNAFVQIDLRFASFARFRLGGTFELEFHYN